MYETKTRKELILEELKITKEIDLNSNDELTFKFVDVSDMLYLKNSYDKAKIRAFYTQGMFIHIFYTFKYRMLYLENYCICI